MTNDDMALVREYAASHSEPAFATLVERHIALVHSAALRQAGDEDLAQEITQAVFILLARKAGALGPDTILSAWLYRTTRYVAADAQRTRHRRAKREQEAYMQSHLNESTDRFSKTATDPQGKNINAWRLIIIGGFFDVQTWIAKGIYARSSSELTYAGVESVGGTRYQVVEHKVVGTISGRPCPFDQKVYFGPDGLIHRFTLDCTLDGNAGSELAELTNIKTGEAMAPGDFAFTPPPDAQEEAAAP